MYSCIIYVFPFIECTTNGYDVVFVLDISVSIQKNVLVGSIRNFTTRVVSFLDIGLTRSLVGLMYFAGDARVVFDLQQYRSKHTLTSALKEIDYPKEKGTKYIPILHLLNATAHSDSIGFRPDYPNIAIILTEGKSKDEPRTLRREAKKFHMEQLYQLFAVGIGNADQDQLDTITGDPSMVFLVDNLDEPALEQLEKNLSQQLCKNRSKFNILLMNYTMKLLETILQLNIHYFKVAKLSNIMYQEGSYINHKNYS